MVAFRDESDKLDIEGTREAMIKKAGRPGPGKHPAGLYVQEAAALMGVAISTVYVLIRQKKVTYLPKQFWPNQRCALVDRYTVVNYLADRKTSRRWHRVPRESDGMITDAVLKEFLKIEVVGGEK